MIKIRQETENTYPSVSFRYHDGKGMDERTIAIVDGKIYLPAISLNSGQLDQYIEALRVAKLMNDQVLETD